jgi:hypothetical protein
MRGTDIFLGLLFSWDALVGECFLRLGVKTDQEVDRILVGMAIRTFNVYSE